MANPYVGQITPLAFSFAPKNWAFCDGTVLPINQYSALYSLVGTAFGGNGSQTFGLPNLKGTAACSTGQGPGLSNRQIGQVFGTPTVTLDNSTMPAHAHGANALALGRGGSTISTPTTASGLASQSGVPCYATGSPNAVMAPQAVNIYGGSQPHNNLQPYLAITYAIALVGVYPSFG